MVREEAQKPRVPWLQEETQEEEEEEEDRKGRNVFDSKIQNDDSSRRLELRDGVWSDLGSDLSDQQEPF